MLMHKLKMDNIHSLHVQNGRLILTVYAFDTEALLISGNGANLGYVNYYKGKFNAYQRTYVLDHFSVNIQYVKWALKVLLPQRIAIEKKFK